MALHLSSPLVSIVIVSYNTSAILRECLRSIQEQTTTPYEIIVVDNASGDDSCQMVQHEFPHVILVCNGENGGFAKANNQGMAQARGKYLLYLNPDTIILDHAIDRMTAFCETHPQIGALGPHTFNADGTTTQATALRHPTLKRLLYAHLPVWKIVPGWQPAMMGEYIPAVGGSVEVVEGSCILMPLALARSIGGMNEEYFMYSEEIDLCAAVRVRGFEVYYFKEANIIHLGGASTAAVSEAMAVEQIKSTVQFFAKNYPDAQFIVRLLLGVGSLWRWAVWSILAVVSTLGGAVSGTLTALREEAHLKRQHHRAILGWLRTM